MRGEEKDARRGVRRGEGESLDLHCGGGSVAAGGRPAKVFVYVCGPEGRDGGHVQQLHERPRVL